MLNARGHRSGRNQRPGATRTCRVCAQRPRASERYATELLITADGGGSNASRSRLWKLELQRFADRSGLAISVSHFPPGTSKWNKIEHRLFCHVTQNWRGRPLTDRETVVQLIGSVRTTNGLTVKAKLDTRTYPTGIKVSDAEMDDILITREAFHGDWNYTIRPRPRA